MNRARCYPILMAASVLVSAALAGCAPLPTEPVGETLDSRTGTTVQRLPRPVELVTERPRGGRGDPFAYVAPFQTNQMGKLTLFLWVSAPQNEGPLAVPQLICDAAPVKLEPLNVDLRDIGLSEAPYSVPAPWSAQWYFKLDAADLQCLADASRVALQTQPSEGEQDTFSAQGEALSGLARFVIRLATR